MNRSAFTAALLALVATAACGPSRTPTPLSTADEAAVRALDGKFMTAANAGDAAAIAALYAPDAVLLPPDMRVARGPDAVRQTFAGMIAQASAALQLQTTRVMGRQDLAYSVGTYRLVLTPRSAGAKPLPAENGKFVVVAQRQKDGSWKIAADIWNRDTTLAPAPAGKKPAPAPRKPARGRRR